MNWAQGELLLINKPLTWTSFDVVNKLRYSLSKATGIKKIKVGHAGTLDPLATGLLIICTGKMTKRIDEYSGMNKEYTGTMCLGATTPSYDAELPVDATFETAHITHELLHETAKKLTGHIEQIPPVYSAIKVGGKAAYDIARKGKEVTLKARPVVIEKFEITDVQMPYVSFKVVCSKGTYIRTLVHDFGKAVNSGAYLTALCRTAIGEFRLENAKTVAEALQLILPTGNEIKNHL